ncbi:MAG: MerR family transcriptional regulator [Chloroflexota bacterium]
MMMEEYTLEDLEKLSGMSIRTLRFYIQEGLLPGPDTRGKYARYSKDHLDILRFIDRLKEMHMPLKKIRHLLETMSNEDIERIIRSQTEQNLTFSSPQLFNKVENWEDKNNKTERSSALEYIRNLENLQDGLKINDNNIRFMAPSAPPQVPAPHNNVYKSRSLKSGETWQRIHLAEGVDLQIRQPMDKEKEKAVEDLIDTARQLFRKTSKKGEK